MIAYFDTTAIVPLLIQEPGTAAAGRVWEDADRVVTVRLARVEARAALARAVRMRRLTSRQLERAKSELKNLFTQLDVVETDDELVDRAGDVAEAHALQAYGAVHLAAALRLGTDETVLVAGDETLLDAAATRQLAVSRIN